MRPFGRSTIPALCSAGSQVRLNTHGKRGLSPYVTHVKFANAPEDRVQSTSNTSAYGNMEVKEGAVFGPVNCLPSGRLGFAPFRVVISS